MTSRLNVMRRMSESASLPTFSFSIDPNTTYPGHEPNSLAAHFRSTLEAAGVKLKGGVEAKRDVELVKQTRGHAFLQGVVRQNGEPCYSFSGTLKRIRERNAHIADTHGGHGWDNLARNASTSAGSASNSCCHSSCTCGMSTPQLALWA